MISLKFLFMVITTITIVQTSLAQNTPQDFVNAHNAARAAVGVGNIVWDTTVAAYAQSCANQRMSDCALQHSGSTLYGENIAKGSSASMTGTAAVQLWVNEKSFYDYTTNSCATGKVCGHYTQVVWNNSTSLGCARVQCNNGWYFVTCNYYPRGNVGTQKPY